MPDINKAYSWAIQTCNAPRIGYSQSYRNQQTVNGITYYDCSSFINYALLAGGFSTPGYAPQYNAFTTYSMATVLKQLGFEQVDVNGMWLPGDIGLSASHTEMVYKGGNARGVCMGAHTANAPLEFQVSIGSSSGDADYESTPSRFPQLFRYGDGGAVGVGASIYVIAALAGNAWRESHVNPTLSQQGGGAFGLFQWDGERRESLYKWLEDNGYERTSPEGQMQYLIVEDDWQGTFGGISSLSEFLNSTSTDVAMLTEAFCTCWERPGVPALAERINFANQALEFIQINANNTSIVNWETEPMYYLSEGQALQNAVLMYRYYSAGGGGGGTITGAKRKMPIWMKIRYR